MHSKALLQILTFFFFKPKCCLSKLGQGLHAQIICRIKPGQIPSWTGERVTKSHMELRRVWQLMAGAGESATSDSPCPSRWLHTHARAHVGIRKQTRFLKSTKDAHEARRGSEDQSRPRMPGGGGRMPGGGMPIGVPRPGGSPIGGPMGGRMPGGGPIIPGGGAPRPIGGGGPPRPGGY